LNGDKKSKAAKIRKLQLEIEQQNERIQRLQDNLADGVLSSEDFVSMKTRFLANKNSADEQLHSLQQDSAGKEVLLQKAIGALDKLGNVYSKSDGKQKLQVLGSIFPEMIEFDGNKCRTPKINGAVLLCLNADKGFSQKENGTIHEKMELSHLVGSFRLELMPSGAPDPTHLLIKLIWLSASLASPIKW